MPHRERGQRLSPVILSAHGNDFAIVRGSRAECPSGRSQILQQRYRGVPRLVHVRRPKATGYVVPLVLLVSDFRDLCAEIFELPGNFRPG
jgi:hypothetical protein